MDRIAIVGSSGAGKSTLARRLQRERGHAWLELDALHHLPGWRPRPEATKNSVPVSVLADIADAAEGAEREALESLRALFAIWRLHDDVGWYLENDYLDGRKARALRKLFGRQCAEVRRHSVALVNAFGIPDAMLGPVAFEG